VNREEGESQRFSEGFRWEGQETRACRSGGQIGGVVDKWWCFREKLMVSAMRVSE
jgi:hypothetical protein